MKTYAVGDIHGRLDLLMLALEKIEAHARGEVARLIFLGDYIDRGEESRAVVSVLKELEQSPNVHCLLGNHEEMMLVAIRGRDPRDLNRWINSGGDETVRSYGGRGLGDLSDLDVLPEEHAAWFESLPTLISDHNRIYVHAGLMPRVPAIDQDDEIKLWIRERFLRAKNLKAFPDGKHIVHGHTPQWKGKPDADQPELLDHRTNLDTGAYATGALTVGVFDFERPGGPTELLVARIQATHLDPTSPATLID
ncbi:metallophosphoesterase family protein [Caulobacter sp. S45]|uniref:metallophosphoesterase family protein n=1 Tax=Caulobacter sp. S45 TaxID=1641861 RepID=UPI00131C7F29|nr:metallophosphoesterase family protein [Caulobacter sp. S45]